MTIRGCCRAIFMLVTKELKRKRPIFAAFIFISPLSFVFNSFYHLTSQPYIVFYQTRNSWRLTRAPSSSLARHLLGKRRWAPRASHTCQQHVELAHARVQVDGGAEEVEGGGVLLHGQVHQAQVVQHLPVKRRQVVRPLQAADGLWETKKGYREIRTSEQCLFRSDSFKVTKLSLIGNRSRPKTEPWGTLGCCSDDDDVIWHHSSTYNPRSLFSSTALQYSTWFLR